MMFTLLSIPSLDRLESFKIGMDKKVWWSIKNDYQTLVGLDNADLLDTYTDDGEEQGDE